VSNDADHNVAIGYDSMSNSGLTGGDNTGVGHEVMRLNKTGTFNVAVGAQALDTNLAGTNNTAIGYNALTNALGSFNIALGSGAGTGSTLVGSTDNIYIGNVGTDETGFIRIGTSGTHVATFIHGIRGATTGVADAIPVLIDSAGQLGTLSSSASVKHNIQDMGDKSASILNLRPVTFAYNSDPLEMQQYGLIAEEVAEIFPDIVVNDADGQPYTVQYHVLPVLLLNEMIKQKAIIEQQGIDFSRALETINSRLAVLEQQN
jgi:hypothetical protein